MIIGYHVGEAYQAVYRELAAMLHMGMVPYTGKENIVVLDGVEAFAQQNVEQGQTLIYVRMDEEYKVKASLPFSVGALGNCCLSKGLSLENASEPILDQALAKLRQALLDASPEPLWYVSSSPWDHPYSVALTHDIDSLSVREYPWGRTYLGFLYRATVGNFRRWREGKITSGEYRQSLGRALQALVAKITGGRDAWSDATETMLQLERSHGVFSSLYLMPRSGEPGRSIDQEAPSAPQNRSGFYTPQQHETFLAELEGEGWELGVHGIDAWVNAKYGKEELNKVAQVSKKASISNAHADALLGTRIHWLYFNPPDSWEALEQSGYLYDSTFGYNEGIGYRAGTLQCFQPINTSKLWELPLHIQDGALLGEEHGNLSREEALKRAEGIFSHARTFGGTITLLWHNASFGAPRFWGKVYEELLDTAQREGAWIAPGREIVQWYQKRRETQVSVEKGSNGEEKILIKISASSQENLPKLALFFALPGERIQNCSVPWKSYGGGILLEATHGNVTIDLKK